MMSLKLLMMFFMNIQKRQKVNTDKRGQMVFLHGKIFLHLLNRSR